MFWLSGIVTNIKSHFLQLLLSRFPHGDLERPRGDLASRGGDVERLGRKRRLVLLRGSFLLGQI